MNRFYTLALLTGLLGSPTKAEPKFNAEFGPLSVRISIASVNDLGLLEPAKRPGLMMFLAGNKNHTRLIITSQGGAARFRPGSEKTLEYAVKYEELRILGRLVERSGEKRWRHDSLTPNPKSPEEWRNLLQSSALEIELHEYRPDKSRHTTKLEMQVDKIGEQEDAEQAEDANAKDTPR